MENINSVLINDGVTQAERLVKLNKIAIQQMTILEGISELKSLKWILIYHEIDYLRTYEKSMSSHQSWTFENN